jgi:hypothetical protein
MAPLTLDAEKFRLLAEALAIGFLVGVERYKAREPGEKRFAGVRTFAAFSLLGGVCGLLDSTALTLGAFVALTALVAIGYYREAEEHVGLTTEVAALLVFWLGYLVHSHEALAISVAIILTIMLASKGVLHAFVRETLTETELFDTLKFLAVVDDQLRRLHPDENSRASPGPGAQQHPRGNRLDDCGYDVARREGSRVSRVVAPSRSFSGNGERHAVPPSAHTALGHRPTARPSLRRSSPGNDHSRSRRGGNSRLLAALRR